MPHDEVRTTASSEAEGRLKADVYGYKGRKKKKLKEIVKKSKKDARGGYFKKVL